MRKIKLKTAVLALTLSTLCCMNVFAAGWTKNDDGSWSYYTEDGALVKDKWAQSGDEWYYFDNDGNMAKNQLIYDTGNTYYVDENGTMAVNKWVKYNDKDYYAGENGAFLKSTTTPDGYYVDSDGVWDQSAEVRTVKDESEKPDLRTGMLTKTDRRCSAVLVELTNNSNSDIIVYGQGSHFRDQDYKSYNRDTHLVVLSDDHSSEIQLTQLTLKPGDNKIVFFRIDGERTWYDKNSEINFCIEYKNKGYMCMANAYSGVSIYSFDYLNGLSEGEPMTLDLLKLLPY